MQPSNLLDPLSLGVFPLPSPADTVSHGIISQAVLTAPGLRLTHLNFAAGQELSEHSSKARALVQILSGTCRFSVAGRTLALKPGDLLHLPPGMPHAVLATEPFSMLLTQVTEPAA